MSVRVEATPSRVFERRWDKRDRNQLILSKESTNAQKSSCWIITMIILQSIDEHLL
jgi:hypothetical protein